MALPDKLNNLSLADDYTPLEKANYRLGNGQKLIRIYDRTATKNGDCRSLARADLLRIGYQADNFYTAEDLVNTETGELYEGYGSLSTMVCSRVDSMYLAAQARRNRRYMRLVLDNYEPNPFLDYQFLTFTLPFLRTDFETVLKINTAAMQRLKKRAIWRENVDGAFISEEFVVGSETTPVQTHYHCHFHALVLAKKFKGSLLTSLADEWTECVEKVCKKFGVDCLMPSSRLHTNRFEVDCRDVRGYAKDHQISFEDAIQELCKYIVKGSEFYKIPDEVAEIDTSLIGHKMFIPYGMFAKQKIKKQDWYVSKENQKSERSGVSLDTQCTTDGDPRLPFNTPKRETMTDIGERMIRNGQRALFIELAQLVHEDRRQFRATQLSFQQPYARFRTLKNEKWNGITQRPESNVIQFIPKSEHTTNPGNARWNAAVLELTVQQTDRRRLLDEIIENTPKREYSELLEKRTRLTVSSLPLPTSSGGG